MNEPDFLDSVAPYDREICTSDPWPLPPVRPYEPAPPPSLWVSLMKLFGFFNA